MKPHYLQYSPRRCLLNIYLQVEQATKPERTKSPLSQCYDRQFQASQASIRKRWNMVDSSITNRQECGSAYEILANVRCAIAIHFHVADL